MRAVLSLEMLSAGWSFWKPITQRWVYIRFLLKRVLIIFRPINSYKSETLRATPAFNRTWKWLEGYERFIPHVQHYCCANYDRVHTTLEKFGNAALISTVRPIVHTNPSRKQSFSVENAPQNGAIWNRRTLEFSLSTNLKQPVFVAILHFSDVVWTENIWCVTALFKFLRDSVDWGPAKLLHHHEHNFRKSEPKRQIPYYNGLVL